MSPGIESVCTFPPLFLFSMCPYCLHFTICGQLLSSLTQRLRLLEEFALLQCIWCCRDEVQLLTCQVAGLPLGLNGWMDGSGHTLTLPAYDDRLALTNSPSASGNTSATQLALALGQDGREVEAGQGDLVTAQLLGMRPLTVGYKAPITRRSILMRLAAAGSQGG